MEADFHGKGHNYHLYIFIIILAIIVSHIKSILWNLDIDEFIHTLCEITIQINTSVHTRRKYFETN
jgi:hypothetical protein